jgi:hypothetical protein
MQQRTITRRELVGFLANNDGGAHVDPVLKEIYADLSRRNSMGWVSTTGNKNVQVEDPQFAGMRQIAHEILRTLEPDTPDRKPVLPEGAVMAFGLTATIADVPPEKSHPTVRKVGRNEPCPCGSGKKYKRCALAPPAYDR